MDTNIGNSDNNMTGISSDDGDNDKGNEFSIVMIEAIIEATN